MINRVKTPCIGVCSTGIGDTVCRGCKRFEHEVIQWNGFSEPEKRIVINRLDSLLKQILSDKFDIFDPKLLEQTLQTQNIRYDKHASPENWLFTLLKAGATQVDHCDLYGFKVLRKWEGTSLTELRELIDTHFYTLSCVHYERYFTV